MKIGDHVKHVSGDFDFQGVIIAEFVTSAGRRVMVVEQDATGFVQMFGYYSLKPTDDQFKLFVKHYDAEDKLREEVDWFNGLPAAVAQNVAYVPPKPPPPPPPPAFPIKLWVPVMAVPAQANQVGKFKNEVRKNWLPSRPFSSLITTNVKIELEYHFVAQEVGDIDNLTKPILDLLKGSVLYDDRQVKELNAKYVPNGQNGFKVTITKYAP